MLLTFKLQINFRILSYLFSESYDYQALWPPNVLHWIANLFIHRYACLVCPSLLDGLYYMSPGTRSTGDVHCLTNRFGMSHITVSFLFTLGTTVSELGKWRQNKYLLNVCCTIGKLVWKNKQLKCWLRCERGETSGVQHRYFKNVQWYNAASVLRYITWGWSFR